MSKKRYIIPKAEETSMLLSIPACAVTASADDGSIVTEDPEDLVKERLESDEQTNDTQKWGSLW